jgi:hypothetical protein
MAISCFFLLFSVEYVINIHPFLGICKNGNSQNFLGPCLSGASAGIALSRIGKLDFVSRCAGLYG